MYGFSINGLAIHLSLQRSVAVEACFQAGWVGEGRFHVSLLGSEPKATRSLKQRRTEIFRLLSICIDYGLGLQDSLKQLHQGT